MQGILDWPCPGSSFRRVWQGLLCHLDMLNGVTPKMGGFSLRRLISVTNIGIHLDLIGFSCMSGLNQDER